MGRLSRRCRFLADGRKIEEIWRELLNGDFVIDECRQALQQSDIEELETAYQLLSSAPAKQNARAVHVSLFSLTTGDLRATFIAQCLAAACLAYHCRQPLSPAASRAIPLWAKRAAGVDENDTGACEISEMETTQTLIRRSLSFYGQKNPSTAAICYLALELAGIEIRPLHTLKVPILLIDKVYGGGVLAWMLLQKFHGETGICYPSARTIIETELATDTLDGFQRVWHYVRKDVSPSFDVCWQMSGSNTISGRSAEAAFAVGLQLLLRDAPYDDRCVISAQLEDDGTLGPVSGIQESGQPKIVAAQALKNGSNRVQVLVCDVNRLNATDHVHWQQRAIDVIPCRHVDELVTIASQQLQQLQKFLHRQISVILEQASARMGRSINTVAELASLVVPVHIARGIRDVDAYADDETGSLEPEEVDSGDCETVSTRKVQSWLEFIKGFQGRAVILGDPGFGKTTLMWLEAATRSAQAAEAVLNGTSTLSTLRFALFIPAAKLAESVESLGMTSGSSPILTLARTTYGLAAPLEDFLADKIHSGHCLLCLDALDEVPDPRDLQTYLSAFATQQPAAAVVLTSRLTGFRESPFPTTDENQVELLPFTRAQMKAAVHAWFQDDDLLARNVWRQISRNERLHDVFRRPILLHMASQQIRSASEKHDRLPTWDRRSQLYHGILKAAMEHLRRRTTEPILEMERHEFRKFLGELAFSLWKENPRRTVWKREQLYNFIRSAVETGRFWGLQKRFHRLFDDLQDSGLVVPVSAGNSDSPLMFLHRTIGEYLVGQHLAGMLNTPDCWKIIERKCWDPAWEQVVLFFAGSLEQPELLLDRLCNPDPTADNKYGDDFHRHRLMLAAQCLPEVEPNPKIQKLSVEIAEAVQGLIKRSARDIVLPTAAVNALRALLVNEASGSDGLFRRLFLQSVPSPERFIIQVGRVAYSDALFDWLVDQLWTACSNSSPVSGQTRRPPQVIAQAIAAICEEIDIERILRTSTTHTDASLWRVVGTVFRAASSETTTQIVLTPHFLNRLGEAWLNAGTEVNLGLRQAIANLPRVDSNTLKESGLVPRCLSMLKQQATETEVKASLILLQRFGESAGMLSDVSLALSQLDFPVPRGRQTFDTLLAMQRVLPLREFQSNLEQTILNRPSHADAGLDIYIALNTLADEDSQAGLQRILAQKPEAVSRLCQIIDSGPSGSHVAFACRLLRSESHRKEGLQIAKRLLEALNSAPSTVLPNAVPQLLQNLLEEQAELGADDVSLLRRLRDHSVLNIRVLFRPLFNLACRTRSSDDLVDYVVECLRLSPRSFDESLFEMTRSCCFLAQQQRDFLRSRIKEEQLNEAASRYPHLIYAMYGISEFLLDSVSQTASSAEVSLTTRAESLSLLREFSPGTVDGRIVKPALDLIKSNRANHRSTGAAAMRNLSPEAVNAEVAKALVISMQRENTPGEISSTVAVLAAAHPSLFLDALLEVYFDEENPARDHAIAVLPHLGRCLLQSDRFNEIKKRLDSNVRNIRLESLRILTQMLKSCTDEDRDVLVSLVAIANDSSWLMRQPSTDNPDRHYSDWLLKQLRQEDPRVVEFVCLLLLQNSQELTDRHNNTALWTILAGMREQQRLAVRCTDTLETRTPIYRVVNTAAQHGYRFFHDKDGIFQGISRGELAGFRGADQE